MSTTTRLRSPASQALRFVLCDNTLLMLESFLLVRAYSKVVLHVIRIDEARVRFPLGPPCYRHIRAYSEAVSRIHGMDEVGVRLPVGPQTGYRIVVVRMAGGHAVRVRFPVARKESNSSPM